MLSHAERNASCTAFPTSERQKQTALHYRAEEEKGIFVVVVVEWVIWIIHFFFSVQPSKIKETIKHNPFF